MDNQLFEMLNSRFEQQHITMQEVKNDLKDIKENLERHVNEDRQVWQEVWFVKKLLYGAWAGLIALLGWKGTH